jgi:hypothetical protein
VGLRHFVEVPVLRDPLVGERIGILLHRRAKLRLGVFPVALHLHDKRQLLVAQFGAGFEQRRRNRDDLVVGPVDGVLENEFKIPVCFRINLRLALLQIHHRLARKHVGGELAREEQDDSEVREIDPCLPPGEAKAFHVRSDQVQEQYHPDQISARKNRRNPPRIASLANDQETPEPAILRIPETLVDLSPRAGEHQQNTDTQADDSQP